MRPDKVLSMLGIAAKSGSVVSGEFSLGHCIGKEFRASLAIVNEGLAHSVEDKLKQTITTE